MIDFCSLLKSILHNFFQDPSTTSNSHIKFLLGIFNMFGTYSESHLILVTVDESRGPID